MFPAQFPNSSHKAINSSGSDKNSFRNAGGNTRLKTCVIDNIRPPVSGCAPLAGDGAPPVSSCAPLAGDGASLISDGAPLTGDGVSPTRDGVIQLTTAPLRSVAALLWPMLAPN